MGILTELYEGIKTKETECEDYMDPSRIGDFASTIAELVQKGASYGDAKAKAFDDTEMPPKDSACCKSLQARVKDILSK